MLVEVMSDMHPKDASVSTPDEGFPTAAVIVSSDEQSGETAATRKRVSFPTDQNLVSIFEIPRRGATGTSSSESSEYDSDEIDLIARQLSEKVCGVVGDCSSDDSGDSNAGDRKKRSSISEAKRRTIKSKALRSNPKSSPSKTTPSVNTQRKNPKEKLVPPTKPSGAENVRFFNKQSKAACRPATQKNGSTTKQKHQSSFFRNNGIGVPPRAPASLKSSSVKAKSSDQDVCFKCGCSMNDLVSRNSETDKELDLLQTKQLYGWRMANGDIPFPQLTKPSIRPLWDKSSPVLSCTRCLLQDPP